MTPIGGYFELELSSTGEYHRNMLSLNSGRNCLEYIVQANKYCKLYLPSFSCDALLEPLKRNGIAHAFYSINDALLPIMDFDVQDDEGVLVINYFGLLDSRINDLIHSIKNLIVDNSQAFYNIPDAKANVFYSPRKFFGIPDGGYVRSTAHLDRLLKTDHSTERFSHLLTRLEDFPEKGYLHYVASEEVIGNLEMKHMSPSTKKILAGIPYATIAEKRKENYRVLDGLLGKMNPLELDANEDAVPLCYPLLIEEQGLRDHLIKHKIFVPQYWPGIAGRFAKNSIEEKLTSFLLPLPVDQRYGSEHMNYIVDVLMKKHKA